jgi:ribosomal protein S18 acetylase RimI-like enzyme
MGLGRAIAGEFLDVGREAGFTRFRLDVSVDNEPALRIYARCAS